MTTLREAAQQALEALEQSETFVPYEGFGMARRKAESKHQAAIIALRAALAEPVQEPVAKVELMMTGGNAGLATRIVEIDDHLRERLRPGQLLYTAPPQRKPLTEEEIQAAWDSVDMRHPRGNETRIAFTRAIERAHGIGGQP